MPIFISYSHKDKSFVQNLAVNLVRARHDVWIDQWELNAGDSLIDRIQDAVGGADAIIVVLSKNSVSSNWCKRELNAGLVRELSESGTIIIPCVIDDCKLPMFLREKLYADFRESPDDAFALIDRSLSRISNARQSRIETFDSHTDWSFDWGDINKTPIAEWNFVDHSEKFPYVVYARIRLIFEDMRIAEFKRRVSDGSFQVYVGEFLERYLEDTKGGEYRVLITSASEISEIVSVKNNDGKSTAKLYSSVRRLGIDTGLDTLFSFDNIIRRAIDHPKRVMRR